MRAPTSQNAHGVGSLSWPGRTRARTPRVLAHARARGLVGSASVRSGWLGGASADGATVFGGWAGMAAPRVVGARVVLSMKTGRGPQRNRCRAAGAAPIPRLAGYAGDCPLPGGKVRVKN